ncbi:hypothetical protein HYH02_005633 [Chlamydomonas schloesseri]|uniref:Uncharacterized protein n=1 Tax=Chlamydomonas schloesseri TaxID=2026947 RepID=A0A835WKP8_9CHLO|nr:hypothetical protein HYH02_005633 [Chlamydomonas schloesseri]|eukprot:KAG2449489.1 hypothetical protein HYH02_005633 [Chlamydomonas schloesseri]
MGDRLVDFDLVLDPHSTPQLLDPVLGPALLAACPALQRLRLQLGPLLDSGMHVRPSPSPYRPAPPATAAAAALLRSIASLTQLRSLELTGSCWLPLWAELDALVAAGPASAQHTPGLAAALLPLRALSGLTHLELALSADAQDSRRWHVRYGGCCRQLFSPPPPPDQWEPQQWGPHVGAQPMSGVQTVSICNRLVDLDLGMDLALTLPCIPYGATALTRLCVGELTAEWVSEAQWDILPEPPPPLPSDLCEAYLGARVRLPPQLRALKVRFMPDVAVLAALAALPHFQQLDVWALAHPQGELCLDLGCVGSPGLPRLAAWGGDATATAPPAVALASGGESAAASREPAVPAAALLLGETVAAAAGLLLRVLRPDDWQRHPLTVRPSPFSFTRWRYERLQWEGPHGGWLAAGLAPLAKQVRRLQVKHMTLEGRDVSLICGALPGLQELKLLDCSHARARDPAAWRAAAAGAGVVLECTGLEADDMFDSDAD